MKAIGFILLSWFLYYIGMMESPAIEGRMIWALRVILALAIVALGFGVYYLIFG